MDLKGLVLAAGEGSRLRPFTFSRPKHLIPLLGKPMIQYAIDDLADSGVKDIGVVVGYFKDLIKDALGEGSNNYRLSYITQEKRLGIAHAIYLSIEEGFLDKPFIVYLGDNMLSRGIRQNVRRFLDKDADSALQSSEMEEWLGLLRSRRSLSQISPSWGYTCLETLIPSLKHLKH
jgi:glucose-1-phosphate thymidylyltransferase